MTNGVDAAGRTSSSEIETILSASKVAHDALVQLDKELEERISAMDRLAFARGRKRNGPPAYEPGETAQRKRLRTSQSEVADGIIVLAAVTAAELSSSKTVARLREKMQTVNAGLQDDLNRLKMVENFSELAARVATSVEKAVADLAKHAANLS